MLIKFDNNKKVILLIGKYLAICLCIAIIIGIVNQYFYYKEVRDYKEKTDGVVVKLAYASRGAYTLTYKYNVNKKVYINKVGVEGFIGENGKKGCVGCTFKVNYSSKDHEKSRIYLGKYEKNKRTVEFLDFEDQD